MALVIEKTIDLTANTGNPEPKVVSQLSIIHEANNGELVQYYVERDTWKPGDKNTYCIGVYDKESRIYSYTEYPDVVWSSPGRRITGAQVERLGVKAFPGVGSIAFYKMRYRKITRIVAPVNRKVDKSEAPALEITESETGTTYKIIPPEKLTYDCYRITMRKGEISRDCIVYELEGDLPEVNVSGTWEVFAVGYISEGQVCSENSNVIDLYIEATYDDFVSPYDFVPMSELLKYDTNHDYIVDNAEKVNGHTVECDVPEDAVFTDTVYDDAAIRDQIRVGLNNIDFLMNAVFNQYTYWLIDSDGNQLIDSEGNPLYVAQYVSKITELAEIVAELQGRKYLYWGEAQQEEGE